MTKTKVFLSLGVFAAAGAVLAGVLMKKRGQLEIEGDLEAGHKPDILGDKGTVHGSATVRATGNRSPQH